MTHSFPFSPLLKEGKVGGGERGEREGGREKGGKM